MFGALVGVRALGIAAFHASLIPNVRALLDRFDTAQRAFEAAATAGASLAEEAEQLVTVHEIQHDHDVTEEVEDEEGNVQAKVKPKFVIKAAQSKKGDGAARKTPGELAALQQEKQDMHQCRMTFVHIIGSYWQHKLQSMGVRPTAAPTAPPTAATKRRPNRFQRQPEAQPSEAHEAKARAPKPAAPVPDDELYRRLQPFAEQLVPYIARGTHGGYCSLVV